MIEPNFGIGSQFSELNLNDKERNVVGLLNRARPFDEVVSLSGLPASETLQLIYLLVLMGSCALKPLPKQDEPESQPEQATPSETVAQNSVGVDEQHQTGHLLQEAETEANNEITNSVQPPPVIKPKKQSAQPVKRKPSVSKSNLAEPKKKKTKEQTALVPHEKPITWNPNESVYDFPDHASVFSMKSFLVGFSVSAIMVVVAIMAWTHIRERQKPLLAAKGAHTIQPYDLKHMRDASSINTVEDDGSKSVSFSSPENDDKEKTFVSKGKVSGKSSNNKTLPKQTAIKRTTKKTVTPSKNTYIDKYIADAERAYTDGDLTKAGIKYRQALQLEPANSLALVGLANVYYDQDREAEAIKQLRKALLVNDRDAEAYLVLGGIYSFKNQPDYAVRAYERFLYYASKRDKRRLEVQKVVNRLKQGTKK